MQTPSLLPARRSKANPLFLLFFALLAWPTWAAAHIESDMPDGVAEIEYQMLLDFDANDLEARYKLAMVYYRLKKFDKAEKELSRILQSKPEYFHALEGMGQVKCKQKQTKEAIGFFQRAIAAKADEASVYYFLGQCQQEAGATQDAAAAYRTGLARSPKTASKENSITAATFETALKSLGTPADPQTTRKP